jgi:hypothetical protein
MDREYVRDMSTKVYAADWGLGNGMDLSIYRLSGILLLKSQPVGR